MSRTSTSEAAFKAVIEADLPATDCHAGAAALEERQIDKADVEPSKAPEPTIC